nr:hypothetical protein [Tanacetum cinerariifolium]
RLRIGRSNFRLPLDIQSKEATLQVVYDVLRNSPLFRAFQVTADVPEIYMQEFWATAKLHHNSICFKIDTRKSVLDLEAFKEMLHISLRIPNQPFADLPTEEEILDFLRFLGHSHDIRYLTDVNVNKLYQPWRSFASVINKCLTGKSSGVDSFRLSQAQMQWGLYHRINIDFAYLIWEDFVYQVEHKSQKRSNEMNYPRFTKVIIDYFMTRKPSISRRNRINWHYVRDDALFSTIKVVSRHQTTQQYGAILPIELTTDEIRNSKAYKEIYNRRTKKIMETINVSFDELFVMAFEQRSSKPGLNSITSGHISLGLDLTYAPSTITTQQPSEAKFVGDFKSLTNEAGASLAKHKVLELEIERLLKAVVSQDIMIIVQNESVVDTSDLQTKLERMKERFKNCIIKKETKYAKLWNDWYKKCDECKYDWYKKCIKSIMETMNVSFDELSAMAFEQRDSKPRLNSMTSGHISSGLDLTYAPSTITMQQPSEGEFDLLFEAMYDDYIGGQPSATARTVPPAPEPQVRESSTTSTTIADTAPIPTNS